MKYISSKEAKIWFVEAQNQLSDHTIYPQRPKTDFERLNHNSQSSQLDYYYTKIDFQMPKIDYQSSNSPSTGPTGDRNLLSETQKRLPEAQKSTSRWLQMILIGPKTSTLRYQKRL